MKDLFTHIVTTFKTSGLTLRELSDKTGIQITRCHRLRTKEAQKGFTMEELLKIADAFGITFESYTQNAITAAKERARQEAYSEIWEKAELKVAEKYGITPTVMEWRITDPKFTMRKEA